MGDDAATMTVPALREMRAVSASLHAETGNEPQVIYPRAPLEKTRERHGAEIPTNSLPISFVADEFEGIKPPERNAGALRTLIGAMR